MENSLERNYDGIKWQWGVRRINRGGEMKITIINYHYRDVVKSCGDIISLIHDPQVILKPLYVSGNVYKLMVCSIFS